MACKGGSSSKGSMPPPKSGAKVPEKKPIAKKTIKPKKK